MPHLAPVFKNHQGFFRSLFTAGFSESAKRHIDLRNGKDEISLVFDDHNITRAG